MASSSSINQWNEHWRTTPEYAQILRSVGVDPSRPFKLTDRQRKAVEAGVQKAFNFVLPKGTEIDAAGNLNEQEGFGHYLKKWGPIVGAGALAAFGIPGFLPGLLTAGGSAAAGGASAAALGGGTAAGTGAALGTGAAVAGSRLAPWLVPAITTGTQAATSLIGAHMQGNAERDAAQINADYLNRALDVEKEKQAYARQQYADYLQRLKPYNDAGTAAVTRASGLLASGGDIARTVKLRAPDGSIADVNEALVDHYLSRGATRV